MITMRSSRIWSGRSITSLAGASVVLLVSSLAAPERLGAMLAATGLTGILVLRLIAMHRGWPPRHRTGVLA